MISQEVKDALDACFAMTERQDKIILLKDKIIENQESIINNLKDEISDYKINLIFGGNY